MVNMIIFCRTYVPERRVLALRICFEEHSGLLGVLSGRKVASTAYDCIVQDICDRKTCRCYKYLLRKAESYAASCVVFQRYVKEIGSD